MNDDMKNYSMKNFDGKTLVELFGIINLLLFGTKLLLLQNKLEKKNGGMQILYNFFSE